MSNRNIELPIWDYNRLPIMELNTLQTEDDIATMRLAIQGIRKYADYLESIVKEREVEIIDDMYLDSIRQCEQRHRDCSDFGDCVGCTTPDCRLFGLTSDEALDMKVRAYED